MKSPVISILQISELSLVLLLSACNLAKPQPTSIPTIEPTITIAPTVPGPTYTPAPIPTLPPPPTPVITEPPSVTPTAEVVIAPTGEADQSAPVELAPGARPQISPLENTNCHIKPGRKPNVVGYFLKGMIADIYGIDATGKWVMIPNPDRGGEYCWVWTGSTQITGSLENVLVIP